MSQYSIDDVLVLNAGDDPDRTTAATANLPATFGATIGLNCCAGVYPPMLATMIAPSRGLDALNPIFMPQQRVLGAISVFGVAGFGGGATFTA